MKKLFLVTMITLLAVITLAGCGVSAADYDKVVADLSAAQTQIQKLEADLASAQSEIGQLKEDNESLQGELDNAVEEYKALQADHDELYGMAEDMTSKLETAHVYEQIVIELILPAITGDELTAPEKASAVKALVDKTDDATLKEKFDEWANAPADRFLAGELLDYALLKMEELIF